MIKIITNHSDNYQIDNKGVFCLQDRLVSDLNLKNKPMKFYLHFLNHFSFRKKSFMLFVWMLYILIPVNLSAQITEDENGIYYDDNKNLYNGTYIEFHDNGVKKIEMNIKDGLKDGETILYSLDGKISEIRSYKQGKMDGTWTTFNEKDQKKAVANYQNDKKHGKWIIWDEKGVKRYEMEYSEGNRSGTWFMWDESGNLSSEKTY